ncbi:unnamed protein product, partial [marine sediment metagenome]
VMVSKPGSHRFILMSFSKCIILIVTYMTTPIIYPTSLS